MTAWTSNELTKSGTADELQIASLRRDGTLRSVPSPSGSSATAMTSTSAL